MTLRRILRSTVVALASVMAFAQAAFALDPKEDLPGVTDTPELSASGTGTMLALLVVALVLAFDRQRRRHALK